MFTQKLETQAPSPEEKILSLLSKIASTLIPYVESGLIKYSTFLGRCFATQKISPEKIVNDVSYIETTFNRVKKENIFPETLQTCLDKALSLNKEVPYYTFIPFEYGLSCADWEKQMISADKITEVELTTLMKIKFEEATHCWKNSVNSLETNIEQLKLAVNNYLKLNQPATPIRRC